MEVLKIIDNPDKFRYEMPIDSQGVEMAILEYKWHQSDLALTHTEVPNEHRGKNIGSMLIQQVLDDLRSRNIKIMVLCSAVAKFIRYHPEYKALVDAKYTQ